MKPNNPLYDIPLLLIVVVVVMFSLGQCSQLSERIDLTIDIYPTARDH